jgi:N utilization substance protein B
VARADARHLARERALELLYEASLKEVAPSAVLASLPVEPDALVVTLVHAAQASQDVAEREIVRAATDWSLDRLAVLDRLIMVLAIGEARSEDPPPDAVILNEAVELATTYSTDASPRFVNGVLATVFATLPRRTTEVAVEEPSEEP